jgi:hypothetical protein
VSTQPPLRRAAPEQRAELEDYSGLRDWLPEFDLDKDGAVTRQNGECDEVPIQREVLKHRGQADATARAKAHREVPVVSDLDTGCESAEEISVEATGDGGGEFATIVVTTAGGAADGAERGYSLVRNRRGSKRVE